MDPASRAPGAPGEPPGHDRLLSALFLLARTCHAPLPPAALLEGIMDCLLAMCRAERGFILVSPALTTSADGDPSGGDLVPAVSRRVDYQGSDRFSRSVVKRVLTGGQPLLIADTRQDRGLKQQESVVAASIRSIIAAPLMHEGVAKGVLYLDTLSALGPFAPADLQLLTAAAEHVVAALVNARERERLSTQAAHLKAVVAQEVGREYDSERIVGTSAAMTRVLETVRLLAAQDTTALILGESGTGKELIARAIHDQSPRRAGAFVAVNCMALSAGVLESELFGHEKGAFTGASERQVGRFELADGGTIFLDEIGELEPAVQIKLLRVLQERVIERVGSARSRPVNVRLVCATHVDLERAVKESRFRQDLFYRINVFPLTLPPLRERREDIPPLVHHFLLQLARRMGKAIREIEPDAMDALVRHAWPGNIRELRNALERALVVEAGPRITRASLPALGPALDAASSTPGPGASPTAPSATAPAAMAPAATPALSSLGLAEAREAFERQFITECLQRHQGNITQACAQLGVPRSTVYRKLQAWGLIPPGRDD